MTNKVKIQFFLRPYGGGFPFCYRYWSIVPRVGEHVQLQEHHVPLQWLKVIRVEHWVPDGDQTVNCFVQPDA